MTGNVGMTIGNVIITSTWVLPLISLLFFFCFFFSFLFLFHVFVLPNLDFLIQSSIKRYILEVIWYGFTGWNKKYRPVWYGNNFHGYGWWIRSKLQGWLDIQVLWVWLCASQLWSFSSLGVFRNKVASSKAKPHCSIYT